MSLPENIDPGKSSPAARPTRSPTEIAMTRCARITGSGRSAVAVVAVCGSDAREIVSRCFEGTTKSHLSPHEIRHGVWIGPSNERDAGESVVVTPISDDHFEVHCHGGAAATARIIEDLEACGAQRTDPELWTPDSESLLIREARQVLVRCVTARTAAIAMDQVRGAMLRWASDQLAALAREASSLAIVRRQARELLEFAPCSTRLAEPFGVVLAGPPNVGKSSLLNAIVGFDRSITLDQAGTTRDVLHANTVIDGIAVRVSDTAGIRDSDEAIEKQGIARARLAASEADLVLSVTEPCLDGGLSHRAELLEGSRPVIRVLNKSDLLDNHNPGDAFELATNALTGEGVAALIAAIGDRLGRWIPKPGTPLPINQRQASLLHQVATADSQDRAAASLRLLLAPQ